MPIINGMKALPFLVIVLGVAVFGGIAVVGYLQDRNRRAQLAGFAASNRWSYVAEDDSLTARWTGTPFGTGDRRRARNVLSGQARNRPFLAFEYQYDTESGSGYGATGLLGSNGLGGSRQRTTHHFSVVAVTLPTWLPGLSVTPENLLDRAAAAIGIGTDIELESEDFNRRFRVEAHNPKFASDVLTPRTMQAILSGGSPAWRIQGDSIVSWAGGRLSPVAVLGRIAALAAVVDGIPEFVWHDNGYDPRAGITPAPPVEGSAQ